MKESDNEIDWDGLYKCLFVFTDKLLKSKSWFRKSDGTYLKGKQTHDYVTDGIERYLLNPEKFNPERGTLLNYLKLNLIQSLVSNDCALLENKINVDVFSQSPFDEDESGSSYLDAILPYVEAFYDQQIDYDMIMTHVENETKGDSVVEEIFLGVLDGMKRSEIMEEFNLSAQEYNNGVRRLETILKNTAVNFSLKKSMS